MDAKTPILLEDGRWTEQRKDETPSEAMNRLMAGRPGDPGIYRLPNELKMKPRFRRDGTSGG